ncbi:hypothetical protein G3I57_13070 [Streptomyces albidoflavus]|uniref:hypothetical protein n=1 Tax=Streptomyces albidoflavus TaxID=1886 RepID=UPI0013DB1F80|nr:hypothetical protein [Streptomyces albidoflavus]
MNSKTTTTPTPSSYAADGIAAGTRVYPYPTAPAMDTAALAEIIRVQATTWVPREFGIMVSGPRGFAAAPTGAVSQLFGLLTEQVHVWGVSVGGDAEPWGIAHLLSGHADALWAVQGRGDAHLLGALYSLIAARAHLHEGHEGAVSLDPFADDRRPLDEMALIETIRVQLATCAPVTFTLAGQIPERWEMRDAADLSDLLGAVLDAAEAAHGDRTDTDSVRGMAHLANARAHGLRAAYGHGDAYLVGALNSLILAAASL